ncbi:MAG: GNAT family N-acetyltransferase [Hyphomonadaceae bacterium]|nr:GNAT family N-acetyltransferase [Hyphomonadaceae bacterium]
MPDTELSISLAPSIASIAPEHWDRLANPAGQPFDPFLSHAFLLSLEETGCVGPGTGWTPQHLIVQAAGNGEAPPVGVAPVYLKSHSQGEYIFDHAFADAWHRAGGQWYPKLLCAVPFTPVPGRRLLAGNHAGSPLIEQAMAAALQQIAQSNGLATAQINFLQPDTLDRIEGADWLGRHDRQFHFFNPGYADFDGFLADLSSSRRKNLRKEREKARAQVDIVRLTGAALTEEHWDVFFACYQDTGARKWGRPYLNRAFFRLIHERMSDRVVLIMARDSQGWCAAALNFLGDEALYGRHWGCLRDYPFLHFELCYYQAIDEALARGLKRVEAGAQGSHKLARGYVPVTTLAANWIGDVRLRSAVARYVHEEADAIQAQSEDLEKYAPFRRAVHLLNDDRNLSGFASAED